MQQFLDYFWNFGNFHKFWARGPCINHQNISARIENESLQVVLEMDLGGQQDKIYELISKSSVGRCHEEYLMRFDVPRSFYITWGLALLGLTWQYIAIYG